MELRGFVLESGQDNLQLDSDIDLKTFGLNDGMLPGGISNNCIPF